MLAAPQPKFFWVSKKGRIYNDIDKLSWAHLVWIERLHPNAYHPLIKGRKDIKKQISDKVNTIPWLYQKKILSIKYAMYR